MNHHKSKGILELMLENMGKDACRVGLMAAAPVIGNLSINLRDRIENRVGKECYNAVASGFITSFSNLLVYPILAHNLLHNDWLTAGSIAYAFIEKKVRDEWCRNSNPDEYPASLPGKILSLPIEYLANLYDRSKEQLGKGN